MRSDSVAKGTFYSDLKMMTAKDFLSDKVPVLHPAVPASEALSCMEEFRLCFLPVTDGDIYLGTICEKSLHDFADMQRPIGREGLSFPFVREHSHVFDALGRMVQLSLDMLPVIESDNRYVGAIDRETLLAKLSVMCDVGRPGAVIGLEMFPEDYFLSELSRLVEDNNAKVVNLLTYPQGHKGKLRISLKIDREDATPLLRSLERFGYTVVFCFQQEGVIDESFRQRLKELMFYLEM